MNKVKLFTFSGKNKRNESHSESNDSLIYFSNTQRKIWRKHLFLLTKRPIYQSP